MDGPLSFIILIFGSFGALVAINLLRQALPQNRKEPPTVFHIVPLLGNAVSYGMDPPAFFARCRAKVSQRINVQDVTP